MGKNLKKSDVYSTARSKEKDYSISDGGGLTLLVKSNGSKLWRFIYRFNGKQHRLGFGVYPTVGLKEAREKAEESRSQISNGINPIEIRNEEKKAKQNAKYANDVAKQIAAEIAPRLAETGLPIGNILEFKVTVEVLKWR